MDAVGQYQRNKIDCDATCKLRSHTKKMKSHLFVKYEHSAVHVVLYTLNKAMTVFFMRTKDRFVQRELIG